MVAAPHHVFRFIIIDEFGGELRRFATKPEAKVFLRNKKGCTLREIDIDSLLGECLIRTKKIKR